MSEHSVERAAEPVQLRAAAPEDLDRMLDLLHQSALPLEGVREHAADFVVAELGDDLVGLVGLERYGNAALLRSLAVHADSRGGGLGARLVAAIESRARESGATTLILLTTTASEWFPRLGYARTTREAVPAAVHASVEFRSACPASAEVMCKRLDA